MAEESENLHGITKILAIVRLRPYDERTEEGRSMERYRRVALAALASLFARVVSAFVSLATVSLTVSYLGHERYGLWMTVAALVAAMSLADFGIAAGLTNAVADAHGRSDDASALRAVSSAHALLALVAVALIIAFCASFSFIPWPYIFHVSSGLAAEEAGPAVAACLLCFAVGLPLSLVQRVQAGLQEGFEGGLWQTAAFLTSLAGLVLAVRQKASLPWIVLAVSGGPVLAGALNWLLVFGRSHSSLRPKWVSLDRQAALGLIRGGLPFLAIQSLTWLGAYTDNLIISWTTGPESVAGYAVIHRLFLIAMLGQYFVTPLWPAYGEAMARGERGWARRTLLRSIVLSSLVNLPGIAAVCFFARPAIHAWVDPTLDVPTCMVAGLALWFAILGVLNCLNALLSTASLVRRQVMPFAAATAVAIVAKLLGAWLLGPSGVAWSYAVSYGLVYLPAAAVIAFQACAAPPSTSSQCGSEARPEAGRSQEGG